MKPEMQRARVSDGRKSLIENKASGAIRYRAYFWLMDASTVFIIFALSQLFWKFPGSMETGLPVWVIVIHSITAFFMAIVPAFLVVARFMRDDYAQSIWQRAMMVLGVLAAVVPLVLAVAYRVLGAIFTPDGGVIHRGYYYFYNFIENDLNAYMAMLISWVIFVQAFVIIFQVIRWKDSR